MYYRGKVGTSKNKLEQLELERTANHHSSKKLKINELQHFNNNTTGHAEPRQRHRMC